MHFCGKNGNLTPRLARTSADVKELFFLGGNFTPILEAKKLRKVEEKCLGHFDSSQFSPKVPFLEDLKKKVSKSDWNQRHIVYVTQIHYYTWF